MSRSNVVHGDGQWPPSCSPWPSNCRRVPYLLYCSLPARLPCLVNQRPSPAISWGRDVAMRKAAVTGERHSMLVPVPYNSIESPRHVGPNGVDLTCKAAAYVRKAMQAGYGAKHHCTVHPGTTTDRTDNNTPERSKPEKPAPLRPFRALLQAH